MHDDHFLSRHKSSHTPFWGEAPVIDTQYDAAAFACQGPNDPTVVNCAPNF